MNQLANEHSVPPPVMVWDEIDKSFGAQYGSRGLWFGSLLGLILIGVFSFVLLTDANNNTTVINAKKRTESKILTNNFNANRENQLPNISSNKNKSPIQLDDTKNSVIKKASNSSRDENSKQLTPIESNTIINRDTKNSKSDSDYYITPNIIKKTNVTISNNSLARRQNISSESKKGAIDYAQKSSIENTVTNTLSEPTLSREILLFEEIETLKSILKISTPELIAKDVECPSFENKNKHIPLFAEINGIIGSPNKQLTAIESSTLLDNRNLSETDWYMWGANIGLGVNITPNIYAGVGLEWSQTKDKFLKKQDALTKVIISFDPKTNQPIDTSYVTGLLINKGEIKYNMLDIPVYAGVTKNFGTWDFGLELGALFNMSFSAEGKIINQNQDVSRISQEAPIYKDKIGMGIRGSLVIRKYLGNGIALQVKPTYKTYLNEIQNSNYNLNTKLSMVRVDIGFRKDF